MYNYDNDINSAEYREAYKRAERRVQAKVGFYWDLAFYLMVNGLLILIYLLTGPLSGSLSYPWFVWPMAGWGIGLLFHFLSLFVFNVNRSEEMRRKMIEEELRRMGSTGQSSQGPGTPESKFPPDQRK